MELRSSIYLIKLQETLTLLVLVWDTGKDTKYITLITINPLVSIYLDRIRISMTQYYIQKFQVLWELLAQRNLIS